MTYEDAITYLSDPMSYSYQGFPIDIDKYDEATKLAIEVLEKQIPKQVKIVGKHYTAFCPICNKSVWQNADESNFCFRCGQKIYWE